MKAVITGVTGFVGGFLAEHLLAKGDEVLGFSHSGNWPDDISPEVRERVPLHAWDVGQPDLVEIARRIGDFEPDYIYHLAALSVPQDCGEIKPTVQARLVNYLGVGHALALATLLRRRVRLIFTSTSHVYSPVTLESYRMSEDSPLGPVNGYGQTKLLAEKLLWAAPRDSNVEIVIARAFQHTGPRQESRLMLPEWARQFSRRGNDPIEVRNLDTYIDLTDVRDVVRAYRLLAERGVPGRIYNVGSGVRRRNGEIFELLQRQADSARSVKELSPGVRQTPIADITRLVTDTGWRAEIPIEQTVTDTLAYWRNLPG
jgi:GDP-4-dehydro-6-deoxy-D-mannose reductase